MKFEKKIWILEDDHGCLFVYQDILDIRYSTRYFKTLDEFKTALEESAEDLPDLVIADLKLPDGSFLTFLSSDDNKRLLDMPFLVISSVNDIDALRFCFEEGALDYFTKPFNKNELVVKIERMLENASRQEHYDTIKIPQSVILEHFTELTKKEHQILNLFSNSLNNTMVRESLVREIWKGTSVHNKTLDVHLYNLKKKLPKYGFQIVSPESGVWILLRKKDG
ncbi:MAG: response regulator transcription factor [Bacteriovoracaceae bacterium]|nr:response regulator transcription factor [Bacteriovoracaceae bacterium]